MEKCALYLVKDGRTGATKIGISNDPDRRLSQIASTYDVSNVRLIKTTWFTQRDDAQRWEANFHRKYAAQRSNAQGGREWFNLSVEQVNSFVAWMEASTNKRALRVITIQAEVQKTPEKLSNDRFGRGGALVFLTFPLPIVFLFSGMGGAIFLYALAVLVAAFTASDKEAKQATYLLDGTQANDLVVPKREYILMGLWEEHVFTLSGVKPCTLEHPKSITAEQATDLFSRSRKANR